MLRNFIDRLVGVDRRNSEYHECRFVPIDAQTCTINNTVDTISHTLVLQRCEVCGDHIVENFMGFWTLEHFLQKESTARKEVSALRKMMR